ETDRELRRLAGIPSASPEYSMVRTYLEWIADLPWTATTEDNLDLHHAKRVLDEDHFDLERVKDRILEYLAVMKLRAERDASAATPLPPPTSMEAEASPRASRQEPAASLQEPQASRQQTSPQDPQASRQQPEASPQQPEASRQWTEASPQDPQA